MEKLQPLCALKDGETGVVSHLTATDGMRRRLLDLGLVRDTAVTCIGHSPAGDPAAYSIRGAIIAIRAVDGATIFVQ